MADPQDCAPTPAPELDAIRERAAVVGEAYAVRYPVKSARQRPSVTRQITAARASGHVREAARLEGILKGYDRGHAGRSCSDCGAPLRDTAQPGYELGVGPECFRKKHAG